MRNSRSFGEDTDELCSVVRAGEKTKAAGNCFCVGPNVVRTSFF